MIGFRVEVLGSRVKGLGSLGLSVAFRAQDLGFRVELLAVVWCHFGHLPSEGVPRLSGVDMLFPIRGIP